MGMGVNMKLTSLFKSVEKATINLTENQLFSVKGKNIQIKCLYGVLWITWPYNAERILKGGQTLRVSSKGKVCIMALSNAYFQMSKKRWVANTQPHKEPGLTNEDVDISPFPVETHGLF